MKLFVDRIERPNTERRAVFLHGILGSGQNLRTVARRFTEECPGWSAAVVDLRGHGRSVPIDDAPPTLETAAGDLRETFADDAVPVQALIGHSFGGKVALEAARGWTSGPGLRHVVVMDSLPGARPSRQGSESIAQVLETLDALARPFTDRNAFVAAVEERGHGKAIAQWLATSMRRRDDGTFVFGIDLSFVRAVLADYFELDYWPLLEHGLQARVHLVVGTKSTVFSAEDLARARGLEAAGRLSLDLIETGHWLHAEDPEGVVAILGQRLSLAPGGGT